MARQKNEISDCQSLFAGDKSRQAGEGVEVFLGLGFLPRIVAELKAEAAGVGPHLRTDTPVGFQNSLTIPTLLVNRRSGKSQKRPSC